MFRWTQTTPTPLFGDIVIFEALIKKPVKLTIYNKAHATYMERKMQIVKVKILKARNKITCFSFQNI